jgi:hypothetical protein
MMKGIIGAGLLLLPALCLANYADGFSDYGVSYREGNIVLGNAGAALRQQIYFIQNTSAKPIWLDRPDNGTGVSAGWSSYLSPGSWAVAMVNRKVMRLSCLAVDRGVGDYFNCRNVTKAYRLRRDSDADFGQARLGDYWLLEDAPFNHVQAALRARNVREYSYTVKGHEIAAYQQGGGGSVVDDTALYSDDRAPYANDPDAYTGNTAMYPGDSLPYNETIDNPDGSMYEQGVYY